MVGYEMSPHMLVCLTIWSTMAGALWKQSWSQWEVHLPGEWISGEQALRYASQAHFLSHLCVMICRAVSKQSSSHTATATAVVMLPYGPHHDGLHTFKPWARLNVSTAPLVFVRYVVMHHKNINEYSVLFCFVFYVFSVSNFICVIFMYIKSKMRMYSLNGVIMLQFLKLCRAGKMT